MRNIRRLFARVASVTLPLAGLLALGPNAAAAAPKQVAELTLSGALANYPSGFSLTLSSLLSGGEQRQSSLTRLMHRLTTAERDPQLAGVFLNLRSFSLNLSQEQELGNLLDTLKTHGKQVAVYASDFDTNTYLLACHANTVLMPPHGNVFLPGVQLQLMFFKGLLDKLHVQADMVQIGKFKGAEEPFTRQQASKAFASQVQGLIHGWYGQIVSTIAHHRPALTAAKVQAAIDQGWFDGVAAKKMGLVDALVNPQQAGRYVQRHFAGGCTLLADYAGPKKTKVDLSSPFALFQLLGSPPRHHVKHTPAVAVIFADGVISDDSADSMADDQGVTPARIERNVKAALANPRIKAIVLRIDSPGGSAEASEDIWQILHAAGKEKPLLVSMGSEAASGGYYIATAGESITADPATITGSIGVVGGKVVMQGLFNMVGLGVQTFAKGEHANLFNSTQAFTPAERQYVAQLMRQTYHLFTRRVIEGRGKKIANIRDVARGRLFTGTAAIKAGLVDSTGSLEDVIAMAARQEHLPAHYDVVIYPKAKSLAELLRERFNVESSLPAGLQAVFAGLPRQYRNAADEMLQMVHLMRQDRVLLALPVGLIQSK
ncbi:MAG: signal peptide peptidase SppA [Phycisphaerales bacterium]|nr:signal peptide peptidase SppA [Phycisphaerales bacterium]